MCPVTYPPQITMDIREILKQGLDEQKSKTTVHLRMRSKPSSVTEDKCPDTMASTFHLQKISV